MKQACILPEKRLQYAPRLMGEIINMGLLVFVTVLWAFSFSLIGEFLAGQVDSDFAVLTRVLIASLIFLPFTRWRVL